MRKKYRKLTREQRERNVVFSSCLSEDGSEIGTIHEVRADDPERSIKIELLMDDRFFNRSHFRYNIIRK